MEEEEIYGIDIEHAHSRAVELIPEEFFWSCIDELAPFGSDEGDLALAEYRRWKKENPNEKTFECLVWTIESVGKINFSTYNEELLSKDNIKSKIHDNNFDDHQYIYTLDRCVIATGFGQLVDEGKIDLENKKIIQLAINRLKIWSELSIDWGYRNEFISNLNVLDRVLKKA